VQGHLGVFMIGNGSANNWAAKVRALIAGAVLAAGLLVAGSPTASSAAGSPEHITSVAQCATVADPAARTRPGGSGTDPNDLSQAQSLSAAAKVSTRLAEKGISTDSRFFIPRIRVDVRVHVITRSDGTGGVSKGAIGKQIDVLNAGYSGRTWVRSAPTVFRFVTKSIDYTRNTDWYNWSVANDDDNARAKAALHKGGLDDLNLYITGLQDGLLGYSTFPFDTTLTDDGVVILNDSVPGGAAAPYNEGDTATHEVGHWLGLFHTFQNGCSAPGDQVSDTPYQADGANTFDCIESDNTCPAPGNDPVHNFMSYGDDPCMDRFTPGQAVRMGLIWLGYRQ
jgi:hypothetical protein